jgi:hypothetical protein
VGQHDVKDIDMTQCPPAIAYGADVSLATRYDVMKQRKVWRVKQQQAELLEFFESEWEYDA